ncbi:unnamed protein product [Hydatigera taeniaeformis]|uniref:PH domain-containing protein n=1 Tax=Hydatigena taeniaeformis TaxID=6205 RepID=A0A3P7HFF6_HYDTA|nr:unnamed protein product [Hydatigera taeniaeformis]
MPSTLPVFSFRVKPAAVLHVEQRDRVIFVCPKDEYFILWVSGLTNMLKQNNYFHFASLSLPHLPSSLLFTGGCTFECGHTDFYFSTFLPRGQSLSKLVRSSPKLPGIGARRTYKKYAFDNCSNPSDSGNTVNILYRCSFRDPFNSAAPKGLNLSEMNVWSPQVPDTNRTFAATSSASLPFRRPRLLSVAQVGGPAKRSTGREEGETFTLLINEFAWSTGTPSFQKNRPVYFTAAKSPPSSGVERRIPRDEAICERRSNQQRCFLSVPPKEVVNSEAEAQTQTLSCKLEDAVTIGTALVVNAAAQVSLYVHKAWVRLT